LTSSSSHGKVNRRGRLVIPSKIKRSLKIGSTVRLKEKQGKLEIIPVPDPLDKLRGSAKAHGNAKELDELAEAFLKEKAFK
jgi:bifunctional DNA-binding transcriptional regulator/antitoxin component of YhaV-PrlF toxin-antitoxin module